MDPRVCVVELLVIGSWRVSQVRGRSAVEFLEMKLSKEDRVGVCSTLTLSMND